MSALQLTITNAGLSAIAQAGTLGPVVISQVAIGSGTWATAPGVSTTALKTEIKRITPQGSSTPSPGIIHITVSDTTTDTYSVYELGLYTSTGVLFAVAGGTAAYLTKASAAVALLAVDLSLANVPVGSVTIGNANFQYPPATETVQGVAEIATSAEVAAGTDDARMVTPAKLKAQTDLFLPKAGGTMTGPLVLAGAPTADLQAATKAYADGVGSKVYTLYSTTSGKTAGGVEHTVYETPTVTIPSDETWIYEVTIFSVIGYINGNTRPDYGTPQMKVYRGSTLLETVNSSQSPYGASQTTFVSHKIAVSGTKLKWTVNAWWGFSTDHNFIVKCIKTKTAALSDASSCL